MLCKERFEFIYQLLYKILYCYMQLLESYGILNT